MKFPIVFRTDINSRAYYESHHDCIIVISLERTGARFPEYEPYFHNGGPGFPNGGPSFLHMGGDFVSRKGVVTFLSCEIQLSGKDTFGAPCEDELIRGADILKMLLIRLDSRFE